MSDFSQNGVVSTLHDFKTKSTSVIESELSKFSKQRKMELILPCLYSELEGTALPKIVEEISKTKYLDHIIIGLDKANETQAKKAWKFFKKLKSIIGKTYFKYLIISFAFIFWMTFLDTNSILIHAELNREIKKLKKRKDALTDEIIKDQDLINKLENIDSLEHYGREKYNLKKQNEDIFLIEFKTEDE